MASLILNSYISETTPKTGDHTEGTQRCAQKREHIRRMSGEHIWGTQHTIQWDETIIQTIIQTIRAEDQGGPPHPHDPLLGYTFLY